MKQLDHLFLNNKAWAASMLKSDPFFFEKLSKQQSPEYLWIGCADSRVPANEITGLVPGEIFVHRNVANVVVHSDLNCLSVIQFAVDVLKVKHIIVTGHYGCGGVVAALREAKMGLIDNWLRHVQDVKHQHAACLSCLPTEKQQQDRLCELNVIEQVMNVGRTTVIREAWERQQQLTLHGWVYSLDDGLIRDMGISSSGHEELRVAYEQAVADRQCQ